MKDSGIEWIGEIPIEWELKKIIQCLSIPITDGPHTTPELFDDGIPFVSAEAVSAGNGKIDFNHIRGYISKEFYDECCLKYTPQIDDIYMIKSGATTGKVAIVDTDRIFNIWSPLAAIRCEKTIMSPFFMVYYLQSPCFQKQVEFGWSYGTQQNIGMRVIEQLKAIVPPISEQHRISAFLNRTCSKIDEITAKIKTTIDEYKKLKQSVITEAVTKGIRPDREMKDSGIEWIGEIPKEWGICKIKNCFTVFSGATPKSENLDYWDGEIVWITPADYKTSDKFIQIGNRNITKQGYDSCGATIVSENSIIFSKRAPIGSVAINKVPLCTNQGCLSCVKKSTADVVYYYYVMSAFTEIFELFGSGTTFKEL